MKAEALPPPILCNTREAARLLGISESHLEKLRFYRRPGPPFLMVGRAIRYPVQGLHEWAEARMQGGAK